MGISVGALGVAIFFLISGFVIMRAVERESPIQFVIRRVFRIYPVALCVALLISGVTAVYCKMTGTLSPHSWESLFSSGAALGAYLNHFAATPVLWSLEVEIFFYAVMAIMAGFNCIGYRSLICVAGLCLAFVIAANAPLANAVLPDQLWRVLVRMTFSALQLPYLFIGSAIYKATKDEKPWRGALCASLYIVTRAFYIAEHGDSGGFDIPNGAWALAIFVLALWSGMRWTWIRPLKWIADISYPLYLVHIPLGWIVLAYLADRGWGMLSAGLMTGIVIVLTAWLIHMTVETQSQKLGSYVSKLPLIPRRQKESVANL